MKIIKILLAVLMGLNAAYATWARQSQKQQDTTIMVIGDVERLTETERKCHSGGVGSTQCSIEAGIQLDLGVSGGCSVTCEPGYYACCHIDCTCIKK